MCYIDKGEQNMYIQINLKFCGCLVCLKHSISAVS